MASKINLTTVLNQSGGQAMVEEYLDKKLLERRDWDGVLASSKHGQLRPISLHEGQYAKYTRKGRIRRPQKMASPSGAGSDPLSGATLGTDQIRVPIEWQQEYVEIATVAQMTSWIDLENWAEDELPTALKRRRHELVQNAFLVGRMTPGIYAADGTTSTDFDQSAEATVTLYGQSFTFQAAPKVYAGGKETFAELDGNDKLDWVTMRLLHNRLANSGAMKIQGGYICCLSDSMAQDLLLDDDGGRLTAFINSGRMKVLKGFEDNHLFSYAGWHFVTDDQPFTEAEGAEGKRANYGPIHSAMCFGQAAFGYMPLTGSSSMRPKFKVQDITKTGYAKTIGYLNPWNCAILNPDWCAVIKAVVTEPKPNNYDADVTAGTPNRQLQGFAT